MIVPRPLVRSVLHPTEEVVKVKPLKVWLPLKFLDPLVLDKRRLLRPKFACIVEIEVKWNQHGNCFECFEHYPIVCSTSTFDYVGSRLFHF